MPSSLAPVPEVGSLWEYPRWNNPDYMGAWTVARVGRGEESIKAVIMRRVGGREQECETPLGFWPGGWVPFEVRSG